MESDHKKWICENCNFTATYDEILEADNPFGGNQKITGCPKCFEVNSFVAKCHLCDTASSCGWCVNGIYMNLCSKHFKDN
jgi:hypothetical protein